MNTRMLLVGAALAGSLSATLVADVLEVDLGRFKFAGGTDDYQYEGDWSSILGTDVEGDTYAKTVATVDLGGLVDAMGGRQIAWIRVSDTGDNWYARHPGSDVDLFTVAGLPDETIVSYSYDGTNGMYAGWADTRLAEHVARVDHEPYSGDETPWWVSLGRDGSLTMTFDAWPASGGGDSSAGGGSDDSDDSDDSGDSGDSGSDDGDSGSDGGVIDLSGILSTAIALPQIDDRSKADGGTLLPSWSFADLQLRFNEIAPTAEWSRITIGFASSNFFVPVPGPGALGVLGFAFRLRRRRR